MAKPLTLRDHRFISVYMQDGIGSRAYAAAGFAITTRNALDACASRKLRQAKIKAEINRRKAAMIKRADITLDSLLRDLAEDRALARSLDQPSAAISATQLTAKLCGLLIERKEAGAPGDFASAKTEAEVVDQVRAELGDAAAALVQAMVATEATTAETEAPDIDVPMTSKAIN